MANKAQSNIDFNNKQLLNAVFENLSIQPSNPKEGSFYYDKTKKALLFYNGSKWINNSEISIEDLPDLSSLYIAVSRIGVASGVVPLDSNTKIDNSYINIDTELNDESSNTVSNSAITTRINTIESTYANNSLTNLDSTGANYINTVLDINSNNRLSFWAGLEQDYETATIDNNTLYFITDEGKIYLGSTLLTAGVPIATTSVAGKVKPDGTTIDVQNDGTISVIGSFANKDLNNLTSFGNARLQYQPFAINSGTVENSGVEYVQFIQPIATADTTSLPGGNMVCSASGFSSGHKPYNALNGVKTSIGWYVQNQQQCWWQVKFPYQIKINSLVVDLYRISVSYGGGIKTARFYTDNTKTTPIGDTINPANGTITQTITVENIASDIVTDTIYLDITDCWLYNNSYYVASLTELTINGLKVINMSTGKNITLSAPGSGTVISCDPCVITTADGRTKEFTVTSRLPIDGTEGEMYVEKEFVQPVLTSNGTLGGDSFAVSQSSAYMNDGNIGYAYGAFNGSNNSGLDCWHSNAESNSLIIVYNPAPIKISSLSIQNRNSNSGGNVNSISGGIIYASNDNNTWTELTTFTNTALGWNEIWTISVNSPSYYQYYKIQANNVNGYVCIGEVKITATYMQEISGGNYSIFKDYSTGELSLANLTISPATPTNPSSGDYWLDNSQAPLVLKTYDNSEWAINNDKVYLGDCTITNGVVTALTNNKFNNGWNTTTPHIVETYQNGTSWYRLWSDGWCEQGGIETSLTTGSISTTFLKKFKDANYTIQITLMSTYTSSVSPVYLGVNSKTPTGFTTSNYSATNNVTSPKNWYACGYIN